MTPQPAPCRGDDKLLFGIIFGVLAFWLFAQTTLNIAPAMAADLVVTTNVMNIAVSITAVAFFRGSRQRSSCRRAWRSSRRTGTGQAVNAR
jgi:hypothetical protein